MSSSYFDKENNKRYSGFAIYINNKIGKIGTGLNEGYTELLKSRVYNCEINSYKRKTKIAEIFEYFFDNPKDMENYYFNHNLPGLIKYMEQFASRDEIIRIILEIDSISPFSFFNPVTEYIYAKIQLTLYKWFKEKNNDQNKLQKLENLINKNKLATLIINNEKLKLCRENPYHNEQDKQKIFRK